MTASIISQKFATFYEENEEEVSLKELKDKLSEIYKQEKEGKKKNDDEEKVPSEKKKKSVLKKKVLKKSNDENEEKVEKKKREPSAYNIFMKEQMAIFKENNLTIPEGERPSVRDNMKKIAELWQTKKK